MIETLRKTWTETRNHMFYYDLLNKLRTYQGGLILDVGCGDAPFPMTDILCDIRLSMKNITKPFVVCDCHNLPFKSKSFGFAHCSHVLEHVDRPGQMFKELKRVARHGYVETPTWFYENIVYGFKHHKWVITRGGDRLYIQKPRRLRLCWSKSRFTGDKAELPLPFGFISHFLFHKSALWRAFHYMILDKCLHMLYTRYQF